MRVHELAKDLKLTSAQLLQQLKSLRISAKGVTSTLDADAINRVRKAIALASQKKAAAAKVKAAAAKKPIASAPKKAIASGEPAAKVAPISASAPAKTQAAAPSVSAERAKAVAKLSSTSRAARGTATQMPVAPAVAAKRVAPAPTGAVLAPKQISAAAKPKPVKVAPAAKPKAEAVVEAKSEAPAVVGPPKQLELRFPITLKDLAQKMELTPSDLIKHLMQQGVFASILQQLNEPTTQNIARAFGYELLPQPTFEEQLLKAAKPDPAKLTMRAPVVTFMGHVDHGKTSLLDSIRKAKVAEKEAGGITQHIGAYEVFLEKGRVTFLDTPGHEAFSALRARGANVTDIVVLVVAADDGVMPQTIEAIDHAKAANVPIIVAINKMDKPEANSQKVKQQLTEHGLVGEDWGGKTIMVPVSARSGQGLDELLEMLLLEAEMLELKADPSAPAQGTVIEAKQTKDKGPVATLLLQQGTLRLGETIVIGHLVGRVRAMTNDRGHRIKEAGPAQPVEILGLPEVATAGEFFLVVDDEKVAKQIAQQRQARRQESSLIHPKRVTLEELHSRITEGKLKELRLIVKADVQGSLEAIAQSLEKLDVEKEEVQFKILHMGVGDINESDVILAAASDAVIVGFHVGIEPKVQVLAVTEGVDVHIYQIIYELVGAIKAAIEGLLEPTIEETFVGRAEIRRLFQVSKAGVVAGCMVTKGTIRRDCHMRVIRGKARIFEGKIANLKRVKDDAREVSEGLECGISLEGSSDFQVGDLIEAWELRKVARKLG